MPSIFKQNFFVLYIFIAVLISSMVFISVNYFNHLAITGFELFYTSPAPQKSSYVYYSTSDKPEYSPKKVIDGDVRKVSGYLWKETFSLPRLSMRHWLRIDFDNAVNQLSLISVTYHIDLPLLGKVPLYELPGYDFFDKIYASKDVSTDRSVSDITIRIAGDNPRIHTIVDRKELLSESLFATKALIVTYIFLTFIIPSLAIYGLYIHVAPYANKYIWKMIRNSWICTPPKGIQLFSSITPWSVTLTSFILVSTVSMLLFWYNFTNPGLYFEDGYEYFGNLNNATNIFNLDYFTKHGYFSFLTIVSGWVFTSFNYSLQPTLYAVFATFLALLSVLLTTWCGFYKSREFRIFAPLFLCLLGFNHVFFFSTLAYGIYTSVIILLLLALAISPRSHLGAIGYFLAVSPLIWSGPYCIIVIPLGLTLLIFSATAPYKRTFLVLIIVEALFYFLVSRKGAANSELFINFDIFRTYTGHLVRHVFLFGLFKDIPTPLYYFLLPAPLIFSILFIKDSNYVKIAFLLALIIYSSHTLFYVSTKYFLYLHPKQGHLVIPTFFWALLLLITLDRYISTTRTSKFKQIFIFSSLMIVSSSLKISQPDQYFFRTNRDLPRFLETADRVSEALRTHPLSFVVMEKAYKDQYLNLKIGDTKNNGKQLHSNDLNIENLKYYIVNPTIDMRDKNDHKPSH